MEAALWKRIKEAYAQAIDLPFEDQEDYIAKCDPSIRDEVARLFAADRGGAEDFIDRPFLVVHDSLPSEPEATLKGSKIDDYTLLEILGSGGMGTVYLAEHSGEGFSQRVALKLIKRGMDTDVVLRRFLTERQILASLDHPNIARMLDGGSTEKGLPYFVMEYVAGLPIRTYCDVHELDVRSRIELFTKVCTAVSYAHQKLVVHRDLKPSNILVTADGEPKLLDFGIAKLLQPDWSDSTEPMTATQFRILTPEYSSPEQLRGEATSTSTDVYSLGVVLYELLTGVRPHQRNSKSAQQLVEAIVTAEPVRPSDAVLISGHKKGESLQATDNALVLPTAPGAADPTRRPTPNPKALRGDLDNIVLKAIKPEPERRYSSIQELLEDLRNYLNGLPVKATADSRSYRLKKFFNRHRAAVLFSSATALLLLGSTVFTGWQYVIAQRERDRAQRQFEETRGLSKSVLYELYDAIEPLEGSTSAKALLASKALEYLDRLAAEDSSDVALQSELADAYQRIGDIQGGLWRSSLGNREQAEESYAKSFAIRKALVDAGNPDPKLRWKLSQGYSKLGEASFVAADPAGYLENNRQALDLLVPIEKDLGGDSDFIIDLAAGYARIGRAEAFSGSVEPAIENLNKAIAILEAAVRRQPAVVSLVDALSTVCDYSAEIHSSFGKKAKALELYSKGLEQQQRAAELSPNNPVYQRNLAASYLLVSQTRCDLGGCQDALPDAERALNILRQLSAADPENADFKAIEAAALQNKGLLLVGTKRFSEAIVLLAPELKTAETKASRDPGDKILPITVANIKRQLGLAHFGLAMETSGSARAEKLRTASVLLNAAVEVFREYRDSGITVGEEAEKVNVVSAEIEKCLAELARLGIKT
ncbi:MAG: protein kinase [Pyrinomonadaceae bacterium]